MEVGIGIQNAKDMLSICYDSLVEIQDSLFIASVEGKYGIIDITNQTKFEFQPREISKIGNSVFIKDGYYYKPLNTRNCKVADYTVREATECGKATIVSVMGEGYGIIGSKGDYIMPPIYTQIRLNKTKVDCVDVWVMHHGHQFIASVSADGEFVNRLDVVETGDPRICFIATKFEVKNNRYMKDYKLGYEVAENYSIITNASYDDIMYQKAYIPFGLLHTWKDGFAGLIRSNGKTVVANDRFSKVDSLGYDGICLVAKNIAGKLNWGVYKEDKGLIVDTVFTDMTTMKNVPITYLYRKVNEQDDWWMLGNDGIVYKEVIKAFPMQKLEIEGMDAYKVNVYGHTYVVNARFEPISIPTYADSYWKKMN